jgi:hypothetical protein
MKRNAPKLTPGQPTQPSIAGRKYCVKNSKILTRAWHFRTMACILFTLASLFSHAQTPASIDLALRLEYSQPFPIPPESFITIRFIASNLSFTNQVRAEIYDLPVTPPNPEFFDRLVPVGLSNCGLCLVDFGLPCQQTAIIPPRGEAFCEQLFRSTRYVGVPGRGLIEVRHVPGLRFDPNPDNNQVALTVTILPPPVVQVPFNSSSYAVMALLVLGVGMVAARRWV